MDVNACWSAVSPSVLRGIRDQLGIRVHLSPAQLTAYADMGAEAHKQLEQFTIMGLPCFIDPTMEQDRIEVHSGGEVVVRIINLAIPSFYAPK